MFEPWRHSKFSFVVFRFLFSTHSCFYSNTLTFPLHSYWIYCGAQNPAPSLRPQPSHSPADNSHLAGNPAQPSLRSKQNAAPSHWWYIFAQLFAPCSPAVQIQLLIEFELKMSCVYVDWVWNCLLDFWLGCFKWNHWIRISDFCYEFCESNDEFMLNKFFNNLLNSHSVNSQPLDWWTQ